MKYYLVLLGLLLPMFPIAAQAFASDSTGDMLVLGIDDQAVIRGDDLGPVRFKDKMFASNCSYHEVLAILQADARKKGGNMMRITLLKKPDALSTCYRITAEVYNVADPRIYEREIQWSASRQLTAADFKGSPDNALATSQNSVVTYSGFGLESNRVTLFKTPKFFISCYFDCTKSWIKPEYRNDPDILKHEQTRFNITQLYARKLQQALIDEHMNVFDLNRANGVYQRLFDEYKIYQKLYDNETLQGRNKAKQQEWDEKTAAEIAALPPLEAA